MIQPRPFYKRIALHPMTVMGLLSFGVFMVISTFSANAETLDVSASVRALPLSSPATITSLVDQQHLNEPESDISGTCPDDSYVKLYVNDQFSGVAECSSGKFHIIASFAPGANKLQVKAYNVTDDQGPLAPPTTIYFDNANVTVQTPPSSVASLSLEAVEGSGLNSGQHTIKVSNLPTFSGFAPPWSKVVIAIHSNPVVCITTANETGWWTCTLNQPLEPGDHTVEISATTLEGKVLRLAAFSINVVIAQPSLRRPEAAAPQLTLRTDYRYQVYKVGQKLDWNIDISGGQLPYKVTVDWGDGAVDKSDAKQSGAQNIAHTYKRAGIYRPMVRVVDNDGKSSRSALLQMLAIVGTTAPKLASATSTPQDYSLSRYLWLIWPAYAAIILMVVSFWLGELEIIRQIRLRRRRP